MVTRLIVFVIYLVLFVPHQRKTHISKPNSTSAIIHTSTPIPMSAPPHPNPPHDQEVIPDPPIQVSVWDELFHSQKWYRPNECHSSSEYYQHHTQHPSHVPIPEQWAQYWWVKGVWCEEFEEELVYGKSIGSSSLYIWMMYSCLADMISINHQSSSWSEIL